MSCYYWLPASRVRIIHRPEPKLPKCNAISCHHDHNTCFISTNKKQFSLLSYGPINTTLYNFLLIGSPDLIHYYCFAFPSSHPSIFFQTPNHDALLTSNYLHSILQNIPLKRQAATFFDKALLFCMFQKLYSLLKLDFKLVLFMEKSHEKGG